MNRDMLCHSHDKGDFCFNGFFDGLCRLVAGDVDGRCIWFCLLLSLYLISMNAYELLE